MSATGNSQLQDAFISIMSSHEPLGLKLLQLDYILAQGLHTCINSSIPSLGRPPLHHCVKVIHDEELPLLERLLEEADIAAKDKKGRSVFCHVVPVRPGKAQLLFCLLDHLRDVGLQWMILRSAMSVRSLVEVQLWERFMLAGQELALLSTTLEASTISSIGDTSTN